MTKPELGTKRRCNSCDAKFFDLNKDPIVCPKCMTVFAPPAARSGAVAARTGRKAWPAQRVTVPKAPNEEGQNGDEEVKSTPADAEEVDEAALLLDDQDEKVDTAEIIGADIEKDDT